MKASGPLRQRSGTPEEEAACRAPVPAAPIAPTAAAAAAAPGGTLA
eukprot:SAG22_NODE_1351_length_4647_cov_2.223835_1_plen_45_part_10